MKIEAQKKLISGVCHQKLILVFFMIIASMCELHAQRQQKDCDIRMNATVSSSGNLSNDGKGTYYTGEDWVGIWLNPTRWSNHSFQMCLNWPFNNFPGCDSANAPAPTGTRDARTLLHKMTNPVNKGEGKSLGIFTGPGGGNDIALSKPLTSTIDSFTDMAIGSSLSPNSTEVRFCNSDCSEYYSVIFGDNSVFGYPGITGAGSARPIVTRNSESSWTITFTPGTVGRMWNRTPDVPTSQLYYYEGSLKIEIQ
jgi:hypothetical protein